jgi:hypothetical protein
VRTEPRITAELVAEINRILHDLSVVNHVGVVWPGPERVVLELRDLKPRPTDAEIERAIEVMTVRARVAGDHSRARWLKTWRLGPLVWRALS